MLFHVGPFEYHMVIVDERPRDGAGEPRDAVVDFERHRIEIFAGVRGRRRLNLLLHELREAWLHDFPAPHGREADCDLSANYAQCALQDLTGQGGLEALEALSADSPEGVVERALVADDAPVTDRRPRMAPLGLIARADMTPGARLGRAGRAECAKCAQTFADGNIITRGPGSDVDAKALVFLRTLYCDGCRHLQTWREGMDAITSRPNGVPTCPPEFITDTETIEQFLTLHPEAACVLDYA